MAVIDHNAVPPVPPSHFPATHPGEGPRVIHGGTPSLIDPMHLAHQMGRLNVDAERLPQSNKQNAKPALAVEAIPRAPLYLGYTFSKASNMANQKPNWSRAERAVMHLNQTDLLGMVQKRGKKIPSPQQYQALSKVKRGHIDQLLEHHRQRDPRFEWTCVYVKEEDRPFKGKNSRRGDYETVTMEVVIMRTPAPPVQPKAPTNGPVKVEHPVKPEERVIEEVNVPLPEEEPAPVNKSTSHTVQWAMPEAQVQQPQTPAVMNPVHHPQHHPQQPHPPRVHQTPASQPPPPPPVTAAQAPAVDARQYATQMPWPQGPFAVHSQPTMHGAMRTDFHQGPAVETVNRGRNASLAGPDLHHGPAVEMMNRGAKPTPAVPDFHHGPTVETVNRGRKASMAGPEPVFQHVQNPNPGPIPISTHAHDGSQKPEVTNTNVRQEQVPKSPKPQVEQVPEWDISSLEDESVVLDDDDEHYTSDESNNEVLDKHEPWRGSLYRRDSSPKGSHHDSPYRSHSRKQPSNNNALVSNAGRNRYQNGNVDVVPESTQGPVKPLGNVQQEAPVQGARNHPIIEEFEGPINLDPGMRLDDRLRGRIRNDIRTRILDDREARLDRLEKLLEYRTRMLDEKLEEARYLDRYMSLRDPYGFNNRYMKDGFH